VKALTTAGVKVADLPNEIAALVKEVL
jgi:succinyl-CoA synthetase alpha subunit